jgi:anthranilate synthase component 2
MILLIDNYDSFSYNLYQLIGSINPDIKTIRNDKITVEEIRKLNPTHIFISPGPGTPEEAGICIELIKEIRGEIPILGVCLGHQAICCAYGAVVSHAKVLMHGKSSMISHSEDGIFKGISSPLRVARYHSLSVEKDTIVGDLEIIAESDDNEIMAVQDKKLNVVGLQFHPESILSECGLDIIKNFLGE